MFPWRLSTGRLGRRVLHRTIRQISMAGSFSFWWFSSLVQLGGQVMINDSTGIVIKILLNLAAKYPIIEIQQYLDYIATEG